MLLVSAVLAAAASTGCGFRPMYGERAAGTAPVSAELAAIDVAAIPDRSGQLLRNQLERLLDPAASAGTAHLYTLSVQLREKTDSFAVERTGFATRANVEMIATYSLQEAASGTRVLAGTSRAFSTFNLLDNDFSTVAAAGDARDRAIQQLAYEIRNRLAGHFANPPAAASPGAEPAAPVDPGPRDESPSVPGAPLPRTRS
jgi:LPS-assembly lipoprotein